MKHFELVEDYFSKLKLGGNLRGPSTFEEMEKRFQPHRSKSLGPDETDSMKSVLRNLASESTRAKKAVHFADRDGLALVNVHKFIPSSDDLDALDSAAKKRNLFWRSHSHEPGTGNNCFSTLLDVHGLVIGFTQPSLDPSFSDRLRRQNVCLESASLDGRTISGVIKVCNIAFEKIVAVRFSYDTWQSFSEALCNYVPDSNDGRADRFGFKVTLPKKHKTMQFAIRYSVDGDEYWDNNNGKNYIVFSTS